MSLNTLHNPSNSSAGQSDIYTDLNSLQKLKNSARKDSQAAIPEVARQFEAVMISMMIKNLRKTGMEDPLFNSQAMDSYRDMYDQQLGMELSKGEGIGFAKAIAEQIKYQAQNSPQQAGSSDAPDTVSASTPRELVMPQRRPFPDYYAPLHPASAAIEKTEKSPDAQFETIQQNITADFNSPEEFVQKLWPLAEKAAQNLGVSPEMILSQAALETGWGKHVISNDKKSSFNLFNIKANQNWSGQRIEKISAEYIVDNKQQTETVQQKSDFRAYTSYAQSFDDYVDLVRNNTRYNTYINNNSKDINQSERSISEQSLHDKTYIKGLHKAGYATDPGYSDKVLRVLKSEAIQSQLLNQTKLASK